MNWYKHIGDWYKIPEIKSLVSSSYMRKVLLYLNKQYENKIIYPSKDNVFKAFRECSPDNLKIVILGQDPYHDGSATGLAFANNDNKLNISPSLKKIQETVEKSVYEGLNFNFDITLESWAKQGILLLNTTLTVEYSKPNSHSNIWNDFTKEIVKIISKRYPGTIFILWGNHAKSYKKNKGYDLDLTCNILESIHPAKACYDNIDWNSDNFNEANNIIRDQNGKEFCIKW